VICHKNPTSQKNELEMLCVRNLAEWIMKTNIHYSNIEED